VLKGISDDLEAFYGNVVEHLAGYVAPAPKLPKQHAAGEAEPVSTRHTCALTTTGVVRCWGYNGRTANGGSVYGSKPPIATRP
jgi:hypothetical protein